MRVGTLRSLPFHFCPQPTTYNISNTLFFFVGYSLWSCTVTIAGSYTADVTHLKQASQLQGEPAEVVDKGDTAVPSPYSLPSSDADMHRNGHKMAIHLDDNEVDAAPSTAVGPANTARPPLVWDWATEHADRKKERKADVALHVATPFEVDRKVLKDVVRERMGIEVGRITFLSAGTCPASGLPVHR